MRKGRENLRKLATTAFAFSAAVLASHYLIPPHLYIICALVLAALSLTALFFNGDMRTRILLITLAAVIGFAWCYVSYQYKTLPARELSGTERTMTAVVTNYPEIHEEYSTVTVRLTGKDMPNLGSLLYAYGDEFNGLEPGDIVKARVRLKTADERYGEAFSGNNAENVYLLCYLNGDFRVTGKSEFAFLYFPKTFAKSIKEIAAKVFHISSSPLMIALLTGDTNKLYEDTVLYANMAEAGILHVVAVSGMNVAFLVSFIGLVVRRKRLASLISIPIVWLFVPFAGGTPSVVRAAFMKLLCSLPRLLREKMMV